MIKIVTSADNRPGSDAMSGIYGSTNKDPRIKKTINRIKSIINLLI